MIKKYIVPAIAVFVFISSIVGGYISISNNFVSAEEFKRETTGIKDTAVKNYLEFQIERYSREKENIRRSLRQYRKDYGRDLLDASDIEKEDYDEIKERFGHVIRKVEGLDKELDDHLRKIMRGE